MAAATLSLSLFISHFTSIISLYFIIIILLLHSTTTVISAVNITHLLSPYPDLSDFSDLLRATTVATDLSDRTSLTLLAVPNSFLRSSDLLRRSPSSASIADVIRYHVLLQYLSLHDLRHFPPSGKLITTLFQTTGRATNNFGSVNVTYDVQTNTTTVRSPAAYSQPPNNATVISLIKNLPYNVSIYTVNSLIVPFLILGFEIDDRTAEIGRRRMMMILDLIATPTNKYQNQNLLNSGVAPANPPPKTF